MVMEWVVLAGLGIAVMGAASTGAIYKPGAWYEGLAKPSWTPPNWLFPVAWMLLYVLMTVAAWRVVTALAAGSFAAPMTAAAGVAFWAAQITLNAIWSPLFFGIRRPDAAMICVVALWLAVAGTCALFWLVDPWAGAMLIPYVAWVTVAGALNWTVLQMNDDSKWGLPDAA
jgi:tryptophan-rich sensory protein